MEHSIKDLCSSLLLFLLGRAVSIIIERNSECGCAKRSETGCYFLLGYIRGRGKRDFDFLWIK